MAGLSGRPRGRLVRRLFSARIPPLARADMERFLERVSASVKSHGASIRVEGDRLIVEVYGTPSTVRRSWASVKRVLSEYAQPAAASGAAYTLQFISREVGVAVPGDVLAAVLRLAGYRAEYRDGRIETDAPLEQVLEAASRVREALEESRALQATRTAKKAVVAASSAAGRGVGEVLEAGLRSGLLGEDESGKIVLKRPWLEVLPELVKAVEGGIRGQEAGS